MDEYKALRHGVKHGIIVRNPAEAVDPPRPRNREIVMLGPNEVTSLMGAAKKSPYYLIFLTALYTGLRRGELLGLRWCDSDLDLASLSVVQTVQQLRTGEYIYSEPKTKGSRRQIVLSPSLALLLREHRKKKEDEQIALGKVLEQENLVFSSSDGAPLRPSTITRALSRIGRSVGLKGVRLHDLRHAHATIMLQQGIHPKVVSERLGYSSIAITLDTYSHVLPGLQEDAARRFDQRLQGIVEDTLPVICR